MNEGAGRKKGGRKFLVLIPLLIAVAHALLYMQLIEYSYNPLDPNDQGLFQRIARNLLLRGEFSGSTTPPFHFCATRPPLYPLILAGLWKAAGTESLLVVRIVQTVAYILTVYAVYRLGASLASGDGTYGLLAALCAALIPEAAASPGVILTESITFFLLTLTAWLTIAVSRRPRAVPSLLLGLVMGLLALQRSDFLLLPVPLVLYVWFSAGRGVKVRLLAAFSVLLAFMVVLTPWMAVGKAKKGTYAPTFAGVGLNVLVGILEATPPWKERVIGLYEEARFGDADRDRFARDVETFVSSGSPVLSGGETVPAVDRLIAFSLFIYFKAWNINTVPPGDVLMADAFMKKAAWEWIKAHPGDFAAVLWNNAWNLIMKSHPLMYQTLIDPWSTAALVLKATLYLLFAVGLFMSLLRRCAVVIMLPLLIILYVFAVHAPMHAEPRYFVYALLFMSLVAPGALRFLKPGHHACTGAPATER